MYNCVVINYNNVDVLRETLPLLLADGLKVVVVDNGSDDGSREYLQDRDDILPILNEANLGSSIGRNQGIDQCEGEIMLLDSDILYIPGSFTYLSNLRTQQGAACAGFHHYTYTRVREKAWSDLTTKPPKVVPGHFAYTHYGVFRSDVFRTCRFDENFGVGWGFEDNDLTLQMRALDMEFVCARGKYYHRKKSSVVNLKSRGQSSRFGERLVYFRKKWGLALVHPDRSRRKRAAGAAQTLAPVAETPR
jgi:glycosyltransferase involved in cell wall biosynthesis